MWLGGYLNISVLGPYPGLHDLRLEENAWGEEDSRSKGSLSGRNKALYAQASSKSREVMSNARR